MMSIAGVCILSTEPYPMNCVADGPAVFVVCYVGLDGCVIYVWMDACVCY